jgi:hypothetical protein
MSRASKQNRKARVCTVCGTSLGILTDEQFYGIAETHERTSAEHKRAQERAKTTKFFLPAAENAEQAESVYANLKNAHRATDRRILSLAYEHEGRQYYAEVGKPEPREGELIIAIFECAEPMPYLICTHHRGVAGGIPYLVGRSEVRSIVDFAK